MPDGDPQLGLSGMRLLYQVVARVNSQRDLPATLQATADGVVEGLGFGAAVVNLVRPDGDLDVVAVAGGPGLADQLLGKRGARSEWDRYLARARRFGQLHFVRHGEDDDVDLPSWVPDTDGDLSYDDAWHREDALFVPLHDGNAELVGVLSVDLPPGGRHPDPATCELLELFAGQAAIAIVNARLQQHEEALLRQLREEEAQLRVSEERFRLAFDNAPIGMMLTSVQPGRVGEFLRVNEQTCQLLGYPREQLLGGNFAAVTHPDDVAADLAALARLVRGETESYRTEKRYLHAAGHPVWVSMNASLVRDGRGDPLYLVTQVEDITARREAERTLTAQATTDPLTGLANRAQLLRAMDGALGEVRRDGDRGLLLFCDVDGFKQVNDRLGHEVGDEVLREVAHRLLAEVRGSDTVARLGGDEFVVLTAGLTVRQGQQLAERLRRAVGQPMTLRRHRVSVTLSVGVASFGRTPVTAKTLLRAADAAMYQAKQQGKNRCVLSTRELRALTSNRDRIQAALRVAVTTGQPVVHYQPLFDLRTGRLFGTEALARLTDRSGRLLEPADFIAVAEDSQLIVALGARVLATACRDASSWPSPAGRPVRVGVNFSATQLAEPDLAGQVLAELHRAGLVPDRLAVEITESALLDGDSTAAANVRTLRDAGVHVGLDDFGTGYASLRELRELPVAFVKVDKSFVTGLPDAGQDASIVRAVSTLAGDLGLLCIAEGIETHRQRRALLDLGVRVGQGFLLGRPMPAEQLRALLCRAAGRGGPGRGAVAVAG